MRSSYLQIVGILVLMSRAQPAMADPDAAQKILANQLFDDAEKLIAIERTSEACPKYAESQRLDPQLGTLLHLGVCYEKLGKLASAWSSFKDAADIAARRHDEREEVAKQLVSDLEPRLSKLSIEVAWDAPTNIEVRKDGEPLARVAWGLAIPIDPGPHVITASSVGHKDWQTTIDVPAGASLARVSIPRLETVPAPSPEQVSKNDNETRSIATALPSPMFDLGDKHAGSAQRTWSYVLGGVGLVALGVGTVAGVSLRSNLSNRDSANSCSTTKSCTLADKSRIDSLTDDARSNAAIANIGFVTGFAAVIGGAVLYMTVPPERQKPTQSKRLQPWVGMNMGGLSMEGDW